MARKMVKRRSVPSNSLRCSQMRMLPSSTLRKCGGGRVCIAPIVIVCESQRLKAHPYWMCRDCRKKFTVRTDTVFARSHVPLHKWLYAMYLLETSRKGISSIYLSKQLGVRQATAWFMLHRLREACDVEAIPLSGTVEVDETFVGGSKKNMHYERKQKLPPGPIGGKEIVFGLRERESGEVIASSYTGYHCAYSTDPEVWRNVERGSTVYTDEPWWLQSSGKTSRIPTRSRQSL